MGDNLNAGQTLGGGVSQITPVQGENMAMPLPDPSLRATSPGAEASGAKHYPTPTATEMHFARGGTATQTRSRPLPTYSPGTRPPGIPSSPDSVGGAYPLPQRTIGDMPLAGHTTRVLGGQRAPFEAAASGSGMQQAPVQVREEELKTAVFRTNADISRPDIASILRGEVQSEIKPLPGSADSKFMRLSCNVVPSTKSLLDGMQLSLGLVVEPVVEDSGISIPIANRGSEKVVRCRNCKAYPNPYTRFFDGGRRYQCSLCGCIDAVPDHYFSPLDERGIRLDVKERPELLQGTVEYQASQEYMVRAPHPPVYFFAIDTSTESIQHGVVQRVCDALLNLFDHLLKTNSSVKIGLITFDSKITYYGLSGDEDSPRPRLYCTPDLGPDGDPQLPTIGTELVFYLSQNQDLLRRLLEGLAEDTKMRHDSIDVYGEVDSGRCLGTAVVAMYNLMKDLGGRCLVFTTDLPTIGYKGALTDRLKESNFKSGGESEFHMMKPSGTFYSQMGLEFSRALTSVDLFLVNPKGNYMDIATLAELCQHSGGELRYYPFYSEKVHGAAFQSDVERTLGRTTTFETVARTRLPRGLRATHFHGHHFIRSGDLMQFACFHTDKSYAVSIGFEKGFEGGVDSLDSALKPGGIAVFQVSFLHTTAEAERRIRVCTMAVQVSDSPIAVLRGVDPVVMSNLWARSAVLNCTTLKISTAREMLLERVRKLFSYANNLYRISSVSNREVVMGEKVNAALVLPYPLRLLPFLCVALVKSPILRASLNYDDRSTSGNIFRVSFDQRAFSWHYVKDSPIRNTMLYISPALVAVHRLVDDVEKVKAQYGSDVGVSKLISKLSLPLSSGMLLKTGCFLLLSSNGLIFWIGSELPQETAQKLFGRAAVDPQALLDLSLQPSSSNELAKELIGLIDGFESLVHRNLPVFFTYERERNSLLFLQFLIEDRSDNFYSLYDFVRSL